MIGLWWSPPPCPVAVPRSGNSRAPKTSPFDSSRAVDSPSMLYFHTVPTRREVTRSEIHFLKFPKNPVRYVKSLLSATV